MCNSVQDAELCLSSHKIRALLRLERTSRGATCGGWRDGVSMSHACSMEMEIAAWLLI